MNKISNYVLIALGLILPSLAFAKLLDPPTTDISYNYLATVFGGVGGVLHGTGTKIFATMFNVFNSGVLALGGIVVTYTLFVSTLNTAGDGELMGRNWSSIWIPIRSAVGIGLLLPKGTGYSSIQVFIMWVAVQGIGAADQMWNAVLRYLATGGVIVQQNLASSSLTNQFETNQQLVQDLPNVVNLFQDLTCLYSVQAQMEDRYANRRPSSASTSTTTDSRAPNNTPLPPNFTTILAQKLSLSADPATSGGANVIEFPPAIESNSIYSSSNFYPYYYNDGSSSGLSNKISGLCGSMTVNLKQQAAANAGNPNAAVNYNLKMAYNQAVIAAAQQLILDLAPAGQLIASESLKNTSSSPLGTPNIGFCTTASSTSTGTNYLTQAQASATSFKQCAEGIVLDNGAGIWVPGSLDIPPSLLQNAIADYRGIMYNYNVNESNYNTTSFNNNALDTTAGYWQGGTRSVTGVLVEASNQGWLSAGKYYIELANANNGNSGFNSNRSAITISGPAPDGSQYKGQNFWVNSGANNVGQLKFWQYIGNNAYFQAYVRGAAAYQMNNANTGGINDSNTLAIITGVIGGLLTLLSILLLIANAMMGALMLSLCTGLIQMIFGLISLSTSQQFNSNPLMSLTVVGNGMINIAMNLFLAGAIASFASTLTMGLIPCTDLATAPAVLFLWLVPLLTAIMATLFISGAMLAYYLPLVPFILFTFGGIGWIISVIEAMVAAPLVALGIAHPDGQSQVWGKSEQATMLLANVFLRPSLMIIGYIAGISLSYVGVWIFNNGFNHAILAILQGLVVSGTPLAGGLGGILAFLLVFPIALGIIYGGICLVVVQRSFSLIHVIPDRVFRWIGANIEGSQFEAQAEQAVHGATEKGVSTMQQGMGAIAQKGLKQAEESTASGLKSSKLAAANKGGAGNLNVTGD